MRMREGVMAAAVIGCIAITGCTGGQETKAAQEQAPQKNAIATNDSGQPGQPQAASKVDPRKELDAIGAAIPVYAGAKYRDDLTRRDEVMIRNQFGPDAHVYTLATDDSFPQVYHYYTTYLAQFRAFPAQSPYPPGQQNWRTLEVQLNQAMQDPFIPGESLKQNGQQVVLQVAETEAEPKTVIRYIVTPPTAVAAATAPAVSTAAGENQSIAR